MKITPIGSSTFQLLRPSRSDEAADRKLTESGSLFLAICGSTAGRIEFGPKER